MNEIFPLLVGGVMIFNGLAVIALALFNLRSVQKTKDWPTASGEITESHLVQPGATSVTVVILLIDYQSNPASITRD